MKFQQNKQLNSSNCNYFEINGKNYKQRYVFFHHSKFYNTSKMSTISIHDFIEA